MYETLLIDELNENCSSYIAKTSGLKRNERTVNYSRFAAFVLLLHKKKLKFFIIHCKKCTIKKRKFNCLLYREFFIADKSNNLLFKCREFL